MQEKDIEIIYNKLETIRCDLYRALGAKETFNMIESILDVIDKVEVVQEIVEGIEI